MQLRRQRGRCKRLCRDLPMRMGILFPGIGRPCRTNKLHYIFNGLGTCEMYVEILAFAIEQHI